MGIRRVDERTRTAHLLQLRVCCSRVDCRARSFFLSSRQHYIWPGPPSVSRARNVSSVGFALSDGCQGGHSQMLAKNGSGNLSTCHVLKRCQLANEIGPPNTCASPILSPTLLGVHKPKGTAQAKPHLRRSGVRRCRPYRRSRRRDCLGIRRE